MKSVGIITFQWFDNYGTILQAYALQETVKGLGYDARIVPIVYNGLNGLRRYLAKGVKATLSRWDRLLGEGINRRRSQFAAFRNAHFNYVDMPHCTFSQLLKTSIPCDTLVFGSDNIWSPWCVSLDEDMSKLFLGDGVAHPCKIVYAASTGGRVARHPRFEEVLDRIKSVGFKSISLRESANLDTFKQHGIPSVVVPDPSLLLTGIEWQKVLSTRPAGSEPYVMGYDLGHHGAFTVRECCEYLAKQGGADVKIPYPRKWFHDRRVSCYPGPQEWLSLIRDAKCLVTNSFHGVMFSLIFNRPFVFLEISGNEEAVELNMRAKEILQRVNLESRIVSATCKSLEDVLSIMDASIEWNEVNVQLSAFRTVGLDYLKKNIG